MKNDISRKSVIILVILALVVSILSTSFVLTSVYQSSEEASWANEVIDNSATVKLSVPEPEPGVSATARILVP